MKIEKISDNQLKITLSRDDLHERDIDIIELVNGSDKTHNLLKDMMEQALVEYDFKLTNSPIIIEAAPLSVDSLMLIVTRIDAAQSADGGLGIDSGLNLLSELAKLANYKKRPSLTKPKAIKKHEETSTVFSFEKLDDVINASVRLYGIFRGESFLVKNENRYFLMLNNIKYENRVSLSKLDSILAEYGEKHSGNGLLEHHLKEHGEVIIDSYATVKLARYNIT